MYPIVYGTYNLPYPICNIKAMFNMSHIITQWNKPYNNNHNECIGSDKSEQNYLGNKN